MKTAASWLEKRGVKLLLFDLDDTFLETNRLFLQRLDQCTTLLCACKPNLQREAVGKKVAEVNIESFRLMAANLDKRWPYVAKTLVTEYEVTDPALEGELLSTLNTLYAELPTLKSDAAEVLAVLKTLNIPKGLVTLGNEAWTNFKIDGLKIRGYFDNVFIVDENKQKTSSEWLSAMNSFGVKPENTAVVGDSLRSDINPAAAVGVQTLFWIQEAGGWVHNQTGNLPEGVITLPRLGNILPYLRD